MHSVHPVDPVSSMWNKSEYNTSYSESTQKYNTVTETYSKNKIHYNRPSDTHSHML